MITVATEFLDGFLTWQTPVSFLAGYGAAQMINRYVPKIEIEKNES